MSSNGKRSGAAPQPKPFRAGLIGHGTIGREVERQLAAQGGRLAFIAGRDRTKDYPDVDVVFLAIPTLDDGSEARRYIELFTGRGVPVVTCEKGALANFYSELRPRLDRIGLSATVGGGTRMLPKTKAKMDSHVSSVHAVVNGTLNFIMDGMATGHPLDEVVRQARERGYAEPQASSALEVLNGEAVGDVPKKTAILFNYCFESLGAGPVRAADIKGRPLTEADLATLQQRAAEFRFIVSIGTTPVAPSEAGLDLFKYTAGNWYINGGFRLAKLHLPELVVPGVDNALLLARDLTGDPRRELVAGGPGAGAEPTVGSMMLDARELLY